MKFYQLGFRYLQRKKGKTILLLIVLILVNSMILGTSMILKETLQMSPNKPCRKRQTLRLWLKLQVRTAR